MCACGVYTREKVMPIKVLTITFCQKLCRYAKHPAAAPSKLSQKVSIINRPFNFQMGISRNWALCRVAYNPLNSLNDSEKTFPIIYIKIGYKRFGGALSSSHNPDDGILFIYNINIHNFEYTHTHRQHIERPKQYPKAFPFPLIKIYVYTMRDAPRTKILLQPLKSGTSTIYIFYMSIYLYVYTI